MNLSFLALCLLLCVSSCSANRGVQTGVRAAAGSQSVIIQPWLLGLTAVVGFLFIVFVILILRRLLRKSSEDEEFGFEHKALQADEGDVKQTSL